MSDHKEGPLVFNDWLDQLSGPRDLNGLSGLLRASVTTEETTCKIGKLTVRVEPGQIHWEPCLGLKPGDNLSASLVNGYISNEQHWQLIEITRINDVVGHRHLLTTIGEIQRYYNTIGLSERSTGPFRLHVERLKRIATLAKGLWPLLEREPLAYHWIPSPGEPSLIRYAAQQEALSILCTALQSIQISAGVLAHDPTILRLVRHEVLGPEKDRASGKSLERRFIWEHTFDLWKLLGRRVGYSEGGPILRFIRIIHQALGVPEPKPSAVRQAIDDFNGRARPPKTKRARSA